MNVSGPPQKDSAPLVDDATRIMRRPVAATSAPAAKEAPAVERAPPRAAVSLLDQVFDATADRKAEELAARFRPLDAFLEADNDVEALRRWFSLGAGETLALEITEVSDRLVADIAAIDRLLNEQVNSILHHPRFQALEGSWRGLQYLASKARDGEGVKLYALNLSRRELVRDLDSALEFDQSQMFARIYSERFGSPGGEPFGVILADYEVRHTPAPGHPWDDMPMLRAMSQIGAAAFAPVIFGAAPGLLGVDRFDEIVRPLNLDTHFRQADFTAWRAFRDTEDSRFIGITLPRVLMRRPYADDGSRNDRFMFDERVRGRDASRYLWGSAVYAFGSVLVRAFTDHAWTANIQGVTRGVDTGGLVTGLPLDDFGTDRPGVAPKYSTDVLVSDDMEKAFAEHGLMPLLHCKDTPFSAFYSTASLQAPKTYDRAVANANARISSQLQCMFSVSRFAHYLKVIGRDKIGSFATAAEVEDYLSRWLLDYTIGTDDAALEHKARSPLRNSSLTVEEVPGRPGSYACVAHLQPHFQLDHLSMALRLSTELSPGAI